MRIPLPILYAFLFAGCTNLLDADLTNRSTFIKLYNGIEGIEATDCILTEDGYIILGNMTVALDSTIAVVIQTDTRGNRIGDIRYYQGGSGKVIRALPDISGYLIVGDKLTLTQGSQGVIATYSTHLLQIEQNLDSLRTRYLRDESSAEIKKSFRGSSLTVGPGPNSEVVILGTVRTTLGAPERPYIQLVPTDKLSENIWSEDDVWYQEFDLIDRNYRNSKTVHYTNGSIIWASAIAQEQTNFNLSYLCIPKVESGSVFTNYSVFADQSTQSIQPNDIRPSYFPAFGFGVVGTRSNTNGTFSNIFFLRVDSNGTIIPSTIKYFDVSLSSNDEEVLADGCTDPLNSGLAPFPCSVTQDYGTAITSTQDGGFVLAGHYTTTDESDNIVLIKLDAFGNMIWIKTIGGTGEEHVATLIETEDNGLLLCGTTIVGNVPSIFLIKTDENGELKN